MTYIIENLSDTLEKLDVSFSRTRIEFETLLNLKTLPNLKVLSCSQLSTNKTEDIEEYLPDLKITAFMTDSLRKTYLNIHDGFWEINAKQEEYL